MKLKDFHIFEKFRKTMETTVGQLHDANERDLKYVAELQDDIEELENYTVTPELYNQIKAVFDRLLKLTFGEPERNYIDDISFSLFGGFVYEPIVPYTDTYTARIEKDDYKELFRYQPPVEEMVKHLSNLVKPETMRFFKHRLADCEFFIASKIKQAQSIEERKYKIWERKKKQEDAMYAKALRGCAEGSLPFKEELEYLINVQLVGDDKHQLAYQANQVLDKYQESKQVFKKSKPEREVMVAELLEGIRKIYGEIIERSGLGYELSKINLRSRNAFAGIEIDDRKKAEIASLAITPEEIETLKNDTLFLYTFYDAVARKGELQGTESDRFVAAFLVEVLQRQIEEVLAAEGKTSSTIAPEGKGAQKS